MSSILCLLSCCFLYWALLATLWTFKNLDFLLMYHLGEFDILQPRWNVFFKRFLSLFKCTSFPLSSSSLSLRFPLPLPPPLPPLLFHFPSLFFLSPSVNWSFLSCPPQLFFHYFIRAKTNGHSWLWNREKQTHTVSMKLVWENNDTDCYRPLQGQLVERVRDTTGLMRSGRGTRRGSEVWKNDPRNIRNQEDIRVKLYLIKQ